jgi:hypothetical protein
VLILDLKKDFDDKNFADLYIEKQEEFLGNLL